MDRTSGDPRSRAIGIAITTLARELGCDTGEISVRQATQVTWRTSALGCPQPDRMYLQVLTPGYKVHLTCAGQEYVMHTDEGRRAVRCDDGGEAPLSSAM
jgi:hypothetical protein